MVELVEVCSSEGESYNCFRLVFIDIISILMILFCLYAIRRLYITYQAICFEIVCLTTAILTAALQFVTSLFDHHMYMTFTSFYMQLVTYTMISFSFIKLYYKLQRQRKRERFAVFVCLSFLSFITVILIMSYADFPKFDCNEIFSVHWVIFRASDLFVTFLCFAFGLKLYLNTAAEERRSKSESSDDEPKDMELFQEEAYFTYQKRRLIFFVISFMATSVISFLWDIFGQTVFYNDFYCENGFDLVPDNDTGVTFFLVRSLTFLVPCLQLMYGFYVMPVVKQGLGTRKDDFVIDDFGAKGMKSGLLNREEDFNESQFLVSAPLSKKFFPNTSALPTKKPDEKSPKPQNSGKSLGTKVNRQSFFDYGLLSAHINTNMDDESSDDEIQTCDKADTTFADLVKNDSKGF